MKRLSWLEQQYGVSYFLGSQCLSEIAEKLAEMRADKYILVTDRRVAPLAGDVLASALSCHRSVQLLYVMEGEEYKTVEAVQELARAALQSGASRNSVAIAVGGGMVGNITGLLAALLFRGIRFVHVPTTLLAMHDSVTSFKQGVNCDGVKNVVGTHHRPEMILADVSLLETLPLRQWQAGAVELVKNALILGGDFLDALPGPLAEMPRRSAAIGEQLVRLGVRAKAGLLITDPEERGSAIVFEYGHTVGHALELEPDADITHGEAVGWGMLCAADVAHALGYLRAEAQAHHWSLLQMTGVLERKPILRSLDGVMSRVARDNKRGATPHGASEVAMVLLRDIGRPVVAESLPLVTVDRSLVRASIEAVLSRSQVSSCTETIPSL